MVRFRSVERVRQLALLHSAVKVILEFKEEKLWVGGPSPDAAVSELHRFFQTSNIFTAPIDVVRDPVSFDELEAEVEIMSAACELAQTVTAVHCSAGLDDSIRTLFSHVSNSSESTTTSELRRYASLLGLSKLLSANHIATVGLKPAFFVQLIRGALQANVSVPSTEQNDYICRKMKKIAADNGLDAKWQVVSTSLKLAYRALAKSGSSQQLELKLLCSDLGEMFDRVAESIELATENSVGHICASLRRIVLLAAEVRMTTLGCKLAWALPSRSGFSGIYTHSEQIKACSRLFVEHVEAMEGLFITKSEYVYRNRNVALFDAL